MDVGDWLRSLGLGQYETLFRENDIDAEVLSDLSDGDLENFGVSFGHRKRLLKAIANLAAAQPGANRATSGPPPTAINSAERRPITVMFCDLVGSTSLAARLDAEDWRNLVGSYLDAASAAVTSLGGHVLKKLGDGLMALFGYPHAAACSATIARTPIRPRCAASPPAGRGTPRSAAICRARARRRSA